MSCKNLKADTVWGSWFFQKRPDARYRKRFILSIRPLSPASMNRLGLNGGALRRSSKPQSSGLGFVALGYVAYELVLHRLFFGRLAYLLAHRFAKLKGQSKTPDWAAMAMPAAETFFTRLMLDWHYQRIQHLEIRQDTLNSIDLLFLSTS
ncbi:MAG: hypothetical protein AAGA75_20650 [Cyanobacteria bacterium P01_E01_bin.6]